MFDVDLEHSLEQVDPAVKHKPIKNNMIEQVSRFAPWAAHRTKTTDLSHYIQLDYPSILKPLIVVSHEQDWAA